MKCRTKPMVIEFQDINALLKGDSRNAKSDPTISISRVFNPLSISNSGIETLSYGSTLAPKGVGHLVRKGTGGRSSVRLGQLAKMGSQVLVPFQGSEDCHRLLKHMGDLGQEVPMKYDPRNESSIKAAMAKANVVLHLIGRKYDTRNDSFEEVNRDMAVQLAMIAKEHGGIMRFIQVSCLGASLSSPSRMLRAKAAAEEAILGELPEEILEDLMKQRGNHIGKSMTYNDELSGTHRNGV
ncbi:hypothetical protein QJS04_geneDACA024402 [Acorus gramineus]|uniref:NAD(P)-binding domain-containing protein n=1 Tax=Acorus gramineus TaxID=55184 RepID=A0AAV9A100_ACOGR|nr:hypothetical protein QJS04_geneDACA024402 [Acorus gramineus]